MLSNPFVRLDTSASPGTVAVSDPVVANVGFFGIASFSLDIVELGADGNSLSALLFVFLSTPLPAISHGICAGARLTILLSLAGAGL